MAIGIWTAFILGRYVSNAESFTVQLVPLLVFHKSVGFVLFVLVCLRLSLWFGQKSPPIPLPRTHARIAKFGHALIYLFMISTPILGILGNSYSGFSLPVFSNQVAIPVFVSPDEEIASFLFFLHGFSAIVLIVLSIGHLCMALWNSYVTKIVPISRMI